MQLGRSTVESRICVLVIMSNMLPQRHKVVAFRQEAAAMHECRTKPSQISNAAPRACCTRYIKLDLFLAVHVIRPFATYIVAT